MSSFNESYTKLKNCCEHFYWVMKNKEIAKKGTKTLYKGYVSWYKNSKRYQIETHDFIFIFLVEVTFHSKTTNDNKENKQKTEHLSYTPQKESTKTISSIGILGKFMCKTVDCSRISSNCELTSLIQIPHSFCKLL